MNYITSKIGILILSQFDNQLQFQRHWFLKKEKIKEEEDNEEKEINKDRKM